MGKATNKENIVGKCQGEKLCPKMWIELEKNTVDKKWAG